MNAGSDTRPTASEEVRKRVRADADRIRGAIPLLTHELTAGALVIHLAATAILTWIVFSNPFPYPMMYPLMGLLLWLFIALRFIAQYTGRTISAGALVVTNLALLAFWVWVLVDKVPGQEIVTGRIELRPDLPILYLPIGLYIVSAVVLLAQLAVARIRAR